MPVIRINRTNINVSLTTGDAGVYQDGRGTLIRYTGFLTLNGRRVLSPRQIRAEWASAGRVAMWAADHAEHSDPAAHWKARGLCHAYGTAIQLLDAYFAMFGRAGMPLTDVVAALKVMRAATLDHAPAELDDIHRASITAMTSTLDTLALDLAETATYEWEEEDQ